LVALALSGLIPEILLLAIVLIWISSRWSVRDKAISTGIPLALFIASVTLSDNEVSETIAWIALFTGLALAVMMISRPDESKNAPAGEFPVA
jgi:hypothetical protein